MQNKPQFTVLGYSIGRYNQTDGHQWVSVVLIILYINFNFLQLVYIVLLMLTSETQQPKAQSITVSLQAPNPSDCRLEAICAKIRPFREGGIRFQHEEINGDKHIFHNYGHGSSGVTLAYGSAYMSVRSLWTYVQEGQAGKCAVVGAGLVGLITANQLAKSGFSVTVYSKPSTGNKKKKEMNDGVWLPFGYDSSDRLTYELLCKLSWEYYQDCVKAKRYQSIKKSTIYDKYRSVEQLKKIVPPYIYNGYKNTTVQFANGFQDQFIKMNTFKINLPMFIEELKTEAILRGVKFVDRCFQNSNEIFNLSEKCVFNCTGFESKRLFNDEKVKGFVDHSVLFVNPKAKFDYTMIARFNDKITARIHCEGHKILVRSENLVSIDEVDRQLIKNLVEQANKFFSQRSEKQSMVQAKL